MFIGELEERAQSQVSMVSEVGIRAATMPLEDFLKCIGESQEHIKLGVRCDQDPTKNKWYFHEKTPEVIVTDKPWSMMLTGERIVNFQGATYVAWANFDDTGGVNCVIKTSLSREQFDEKFSQTGIVL